MTRAAIYARISRDRVGAGLGVDRQERECRELAERLGYTVVAVYTDNDLSAYSGKPRPEYLRLLADVEAGLVDVVLAWHSDRLHRSPTELEAYIGVCEKRGVPTHCATAGPLDLATPSGRLVARQLGAVARYEVEHLIERQQAAKQQIAAAGIWGGGRRPFGYEADGVTVRPTEAEAVAEVTDAILLGGSLRAQAARLNAAGIKTSTGREWKPTELKKLVTRTRNAGLREHKGQIIGQAEWPAIVPEEKWRAARAVLADPERRTNGGTARRWLLSGVARCGVCDATMRVVSMATTRRAVPSYACSAHKCVVRNAAELDEYVSLVMAERLRRPGTAEAMLPPAPAIDLAALAAEETNLREQLDEMGDDLDLPPRVLARRTKALQERLDEIGALKAVAGRSNVLAGIVDAPDPGQAWLDLDDLDRKRAVLELFMSITVNRAAKGRRPGWKPGESYFDPSTVDIT